MARISSNNFVLINLEGGGSFVFELFPKEIQSTDRANWEPQDVSIGVKPLFYANTEPRRISVPEVYLDGTRTGQSIGGDLDALRALKNETSKGTPPALLAVWGSRQQRCVMEECVISEIFFEPGGDPLRARVSLQLVELQLEEQVTVSVTPLDNTRPESWPF